MRVTSDAGTFYTYMRVAIDRCGVVFATFLQRLMFFLLLLHTLVSKHAYTPVYSSQRNRSRRIIVTAQSSRQG